MVWMRARHRDPTSSPAASRLRLLLGPASVLAVLQTILVLHVLGSSAAWQAALLVLLVLFASFRLAIAAVTMLIGSLAASDGRVAEAPPRGRPSRTALLLPVCNEPTETIAAAVRVMTEALDAGDRIAMFVLSDTTDPALAAREAAAFAPRAWSRSGVEIRYRRRLANTGRKAGNIADFCRHHAHAFEFAIILDADSLMTADALRGLVAAMRDDPRAALIQSVSYPIGGATLFARMQQFSARLNTPLSVAGQHVWQGARGTYWGHNAIVRLAPFVAHATLPVLSGRPPLGGEILCHDTIEAALLLRAGWELKLAPQLVGSYETTPGNLVDHLARERRWCQGNLQHLRLLAEPGYRPESRFHIGVGIAYYLASPLGLLLSALLLAHGGGSPGAAADRSPGGSAALLIGLTVLLVFGPRLLALVQALGDGERARGFGGRIRLVASVLAEQVAGTLLAPVIACSVTGFVFATFAGRVVTWRTQSRGDRPVGWGEAWRRFRVHTVLGVLLLLAIALTRPLLLPWAAPFLCGLVASIPAAVCSGSIRLGALAQRLGLFQTVDELAPGVEQRQLYGADARHPAAPAAA